MNSNTHTKIPNHPNRHNMQAHANTINVCLINLLGIINVGIDCYQSDWSGIEMLDCSIRVFNCCIKN